MQIEPEDSALPSPSWGPSTAAPAPSAKITAVLRPRVLTSILVDCTSCPDDEHASIGAGRMKASATCSA